MAKIIELNEKNFNQIVEEGITLVAFSAPWCGPCRMMNPIYEDLAKTIKVGKVNCDEDGELASKYGVKSIPALFVFKDGKQMKNHVGAVSKMTIEGWLEEFKN